MPEDQNAALRIPVLSVVAVALAAIGALFSLALGFLILGEDLTGVVPARWLVIFAASSAGTLVLLIAAAMSGRCRRSDGGRSTSCSVRK